MNQTEESIRYEVRVIWHKYNSGDGNSGVRLGRVMTSDYFKAQMLLKLAIRVAGQESRWSGKFVDKYFGDCGFVEEVVGLFEFKIAETKLADGVTKSDVCYRRRKKES